MAAIYASRFQSVLPTGCLSWGKELFSSPSSLFPACSHHGTVQLPRSSLQTKEGGGMCCIAPCACKAFLPVVKCGDGEGEGFFFASPLTFCPFLSSVWSPMLAVTFLPFPACSPNTGCVPCLSLFSFNPRDGPVTNPHCIFLNQSPLS